MADIAAARAEIQKVVSFLVNRFGSEEEVFNHLTLALSYLQEPPPARVEVSLPLVAAEARKESEPGSSEESAPAASELEAESDLVAEILEVETIEFVEPVVEEPPRPPQRHTTRRHRR